MIKILKNDDGIALVETAILFPVILTMLFGMYDGGKAYLMKQRTILAAHLAADLVGRKYEVNAIDVSNAIEAARLVYTPFDTDTYGIDIVSVQFDEDNSPVVRWRETYGMAENDIAVENSEGLGEYGEGVLAVTVKYYYEPTFTGALFDGFEMIEVAYTQGRRRSYVSHEDYDDS